MGQHVNAMKAGTFDGGYTLEPSATIIEKIGAGNTVEAGVIAKYILGDVDANAYAAGCAFTYRLHQGAARRRQALRRRLGQGDRLHQRRIRTRRASISPRTR